MELKHIEIKLARATTLPILPNVIAQLLHLTDNPNASARDYERVISQDAGMAAKILRTANSPYYGGNGQITTVQRATVQLGVNSVRSICMAVAYQAALANKTLSKSFDSRAYWQHCLGVACAAKIMARIVHSPLYEEAFVAGLVHDIGKLAMWMFLPLEAEMVVRQVTAQKITYYEAEMELLNLTHQEIGQLAAERWQLPEMFFAPISKHHTPTEDVFEIDPLTAFVHTGNVLAHQIMADSALGDTEYTLDSLVENFLGIAPEQYQPIRQAVAKEVVLIGQFFGI